MADIHSSIASRSSRSERPSKRAVAHLVKQAELHAEDARTMLDVQRFALAACASYLALCAAARTQLAAAGESSAGDFSDVLERITLLMGDSYGFAKDLARAHRAIEQVDDGELDALSDAHVRPLVDSAERLVDIVRQRTLGRNGEA
ncbi:MAG: hypothetical protein GC206_00975 [Alphaproteobacteria bacterium]|nr:hypothetical protein [Alphaproteobacteria bacterium]